MLDILLRSNFSLLRSLVSSNFVRSLGINTGIFVAIFMAFFVFSRATGLVSIVGYEWKMGAGSGLLGTSRSPISIVTPVYLRQGEQLIGQYNANITSGSVQIYLRQGFLPFFRKISDTNQSITQSGEGEIIVTVEEDGFYWPHSATIWGSRSSECIRKKRQKSLFESLVVPDFECPNYKLSYSILWSVRQ